MTGESRGFGFIEMPNDAEARAAIQNARSADDIRRVAKRWFGATF